jgi:hypothetical protein
VQNAHVNQVLIDDVWSARAGPEGARSQIMAVTRQAQVSRNWSEMLAAKKIVKGRLLTASRWGDRQTRSGRGRALECVLCTMTTLGLMRGSRESSMAFYCVCGTNAQMKNLSTATHRLLYKTFHLQRQDIHHLPESVGAESSMHVRHDSAISIDSAFRELENEVGAGHTPPPVSLPRVH